MEFWLWMPQLFACTRARIKTQINRGLSPIVVCPLLLAHAGQADQQAGEGTGCNQHPIHRLPICRQQAAPSEVIEHLRHARVQRLGRGIHGQFRFQGRFVG